MDKPITGKDLTIFRLEMEKYIGEQIAVSAAKKKSLWDSLSAKELAVIAPLAFGALTKLFEVAGTVLREVVK